jgi:hypothetical protein
MNKIIKIIKKEIYFFLNNELRQDGNNNISIL